jgi:hypothetical protein
MALVIAVKADQVPIARPRRSLSENVALMIASCPAPGAPRPTPWRARAMSASTDGAMPQPIEAIAKTATPTAVDAAAPEVVASEPPTRNHAARNRA